MIWFTMTTQVSQSQLITTQFYKLMPHKICIWKMRVDSLKSANRLVSRKYRVRYQEEDIEPVDFMVVCEINKYKLKKSKILVTVKLLTTNTDAHDIKIEISSSKRQQISRLLRGCDTAQFMYGYKKIKSLQLLTIQLEVIKYTVFNSIL